MITDCSVQTEEPDEALDFDFKTSNVVNKIIMQVEKTLNMSKSYVKIWQPTNLTCVSLCVLRKYTRLYNRSPSLLGVCLFLDVRIGS